MQAAEARQSADTLDLVGARCCLCGHADGHPVAVGEDFEYRSSADTFLAMRCEQCGLIYLNPRPASHELARLYPSNYHAYDFSAENFGFVHAIRRRLEAKRLLKYCRQLGKHSRILDVGCGDGFHLGLLRDFGDPTWSLEGLDLSPAAVAAAKKVNLNVVLADVETAGLPAMSFDLVLLIATVEHVADPLGLLTAVRRLLKPGGRVLVVTDNIRTLDWRIFGRRHWGGYHFPRHWYLFDAVSLGGLAAKAGLEVENIHTILSPVNWVYSIRNYFTDKHAPLRVIRQFSLKTPVSLAVFTLVDAMFTLTGHGALLRMIARRPE